MRDIIIEFGGAILAVVAVTFMLVLFGGGDTGALNSAGDTGIVQLEDAGITDSTEDNTLYNTVVGRSLPTAVVSRRVLQRVDFQLIPCFTIKNYEGYLYDSSIGKFKNSSGNTLGGYVEVLSIKDSYGTEFLSSYNAMNDTINLENKGTYLIKLHIADHENSSDVVYLQLPVDIN